MMTLVSDAELPIDAESIEFLRDPQPTYRRLREQAPAYDWTARRALLFSRYDHVRQLLTDDRLTTNKRAWEHWSPVSLEGERICPVDCVEAWADLDYSSITNEKFSIQSMFGMRVCEEMEGNVPCQE